MKHQLCALCGSKAVLFLHLVTSFPKTVIIFGAAMSCMEKCSRADIGFQLMKRMKEEGIAPNVHIYNSAISACARSNLWEKGYELFQEMDRAGVRKDVVTYNAGMFHSKVASSRCVKKIT
jgi:pentatricopeptide repeat protein